MKILKMRLENFQGVKELEIDPQGESSAIYGDNLCRGCYVDALRLVGAVRTDRCTSGHVWSILGVCAEIRKGKHQGRHCVRHEHKAGRN